MTTTGKKKTKKKKMDESMDGPPLAQEGQCPSKFFEKNILLYIYIYVLILAILFYKITFCFSLKISLILLRVIPYSQTF